MKASDGNTLCEEILVSILTSAVLRLDEPTRVKRLLVILVSKCSVTFEGGSTMGSGSCVSTCLHSTVGCPVTRWSR